MKTKMSEKEPEIPKTTSSNPFLRRVSTRKKKKEPTLDLSIEKEEEGSFEDVEEVEMESSSKELESEEEEAELETPLLEKTRLKTRALEWKKATPVFKIPVSAKRPIKGKTLKKGESFQKNLKRK